MTGREQDIIKASDHADRSKNGEPGVLLIGGPSGIGKTTFVNHLLGLYPDAVALNTRIIDSVSLPYAPYTSAMRAIFQMFPEIQQQLILSDHLYPLLPELQQEEPVQASRQSMSEAIREVFLKVMEQAFLIFVIEDMHRADAATLELIPQHLESFSYSAPLLFVGTYRDEQLSPDHKLRWLRTELRRSNLFLELSLDALSRDDLSELLQHELQTPPDSDLVQGIYKKTAGNPLFSLELVRALRGKNLLTTCGDRITFTGGDIPVPDSIRDVVILQTKNLPQDLKYALEIAALLGDEFSLEILSQLTGHPEVVDELLKTEFVLESPPGTGVFKHSLFREAIGYNILWSRRQQIYQHIAETLTRRDAEPKVTGEFYLKAGNNHEAVTAFSRAARRYCSIFAYKDALAAAQKALKNWPANNREEERLELLQESARCARLSGQIYESIQALRELAEARGFKHNPQRQGEVQRDLATCYALQGAWSSFKQARKQAALEFETAGLNYDAAREWSALANQYINELNAAAAVDTIDKALGNLRNSTNNDLKSKVLGMKGYALSLQGKTAEGHELARKAMSLALNENNAESVAYAYRKLAGTFKQASDFNQSLKVYDTALSFCYKENMNIQAQLCLSCMSWVLFRLGDWKRGLEVSYEVINDPQTNNPSKAAANVVVGIIRSYRGELKQAKNHLDQGLMLSQKENFKLITLVSDWAYAAYYKLNGEDKEAEQYYNDLIVHGEEFNDMHDVLPGLVAASTFFAERKKHVTLTRCIKILSEVCDATGNPEAVGSLAYALGQRFKLSGEYADADKQFRHAIRQFDEINTPLQLILARKGYGEVLMMQSEPGDAAEEFKQALKKAKDLGLRPWAGDLTVILEHLGVTKTEARNHIQPAEINRAGLTLRQAEVIQEMAKGFSNKEIASRLHLSTRTVDMHVSNILSRLNCRSRTEAVKIALDRDFLV